MSRFYVELEQVVERNGYPQHQKSEILACARRAEFLSELLVRAAQFCQRGLAALRPRMSVRPLNG
jgi:hypothetical protein